MLFALVDGYDQAISFNTQFFHDGRLKMTTSPDLTTGMTVVGSVLLPPRRRATSRTSWPSSREAREGLDPQYVNYMKKVKRVDVRKLKKNIREGLDIKPPKQKNPDNSVDVVDEGENGGSLTDPTEPRVFDSVVSSLRKTYPRGEMQDVSTSSCFTRWLHPANERGLKIEVGESPDAEGEAEPEEGDNTVVGLWDLKSFYSPLGFGYLRLRLV
ncbi:hypothetical protein BDM02DRAFT_3235350 [Thelephora ganbajun]|uniref:Uncharacterized protein n=1 Tax=Thelephora ganbajun TaxID=370292 RepID=A0ACB6ZHE7_THEGA|nr:hypothetical protein BDM02DRAFT_3235350 [Thelephora ganbajun]